MRSNATLMVTIISYKALHLAHNSYTHSQSTSFPITHIYYILYDLTFHSTQLNVVVANRVTGIFPAVNIMGEGKEGRGI